MHTATCRGAPDYALRANPGYRNVLDDAYKPYRGACIAVARIRPQAVIRDRWAVGRLHTATCRGAPDYALRTNPGYRNVLDDAYKPYRGACIVVARIRPQAVIRDRRAVGRLHTATCRGAPDYALRTNPGYRNVLDGAYKPYRGACALS